MHCLECHDGDDLLFGGICAYCGVSRCAVCGLVGEWPSSIDDGPLCNAHGLFCASCDEFNQTDYMHLIDGVWYCEGCCAYCIEHDTWYSDEYCPLGEDDEEPYDPLDYPEEEGATPRETIRNYSYKPEPVFFGGRLPDLLNMGVEHEMEFPSSRAVSDALTVVGRYNAELGRPFYCKSDGSISNGFEMVSHPFTPDWFEQFYPFDMLDELKELGASPKNSYGQDSAGIHVHISRDSFTTLHMYKFLHFHYMIAGDLCKLVAGRESHWARFDAEVGVGSSLKRKPNGDYERSYAKSMREVASKKKKNSDRYVAVNMRNDATVELRYFRSTAKKERLKAYIQFVVAVWHYTKEAAMTRKSKSKRVMSQDDFIAYVRENEERFPDLVGLLNKEEAYRVD